ncbi:unnamed protein product [Brassica oleracea]
MRYETFAAGCNSGPLPTVWAFSPALVLSDRLCLRRRIFSIDWRSALLLGSGSSFSTGFTDFSLQEMVASLAPFSPALYGVLPI